MRYRQCLTRGLSLIKLHVSHIVRSLALEVLRELNANPKEKLNLLYIKFRVIAASLRPLIAELEQRCEKREEQVVLLILLYEYNVGIADMDLYWKTVWALISITEICY